MKSLYDFSAGCPLGGEIDMEVQIALLPVPPQLELTDRIDARDLFMVKPLVDIAVPDNADDVFYWRSDYF